MNRTAGVIALFSVNVFLVLALLGWYLVERPDRQTPVRRRRFLLLFYGLLTTIIIEMTVLGVALFGGADHGG